MWKEGCARGFRLDCWFAKDKVRCNKPSGPQDHACAEEYRHVEIHHPECRALPPQGVLNILFRVIHPCFKGDRDSH